MKREDLIKLGIAEDLVDKIMALHGTDIESHKTKVATAQTELDAIKKQLSDANNEIDGFKKLDIEGVKKAADDYKAKFETAQADAQKQLAQLKFDHALDGALTGAKAKNAKAVRALLNMDALKLNEADGSIIGLKDQLEQIQKDNDYLFAGESASVLASDPHIVTGGNPPQKTIDAFDAALRRGAGLPEEK